jgi:hypothetical protein
MTSLPQTIYTYTPVVDFNKNSYFNVKKIYIEKEKVIEASTNQPHAFFVEFILNSDGEYETTGQYYKHGVLAQHCETQLKIVGKGNRNK